MPSCALSRLLVTILSHSGRSSPPLKALGKLAGQGQSILYGSPVLSILYDAAVLSIHCNQLVWSFIIFGIKFTAQILEVGKQQHGLPHFKISGCWPIIACP